MSSPGLTLRVLPDSDAVAQFRAQQFLDAVAARPELVFLGNTGRTPRAMYRLIAAQAPDLSRVRLRLLDCWVLAPETGFDSLQHPASFTGYVQDAFLRLLPEAYRPRDVRMLPEALTTCRELEQALAAQHGVWHRPPHPRTGQPGAEVVISAAATGVLARVRDACAEYETLLAAAPPDVVSLGIGQRPYPHMAFNNGPFTRVEAPTHLTHTDEAVRLAESAAFGGVERVPGFALTVGPATILGGGSVWVTATGAGKAAAVAELFLDPGAADHELRGSMAYVLRHAAADLLLDQAAAAELLRDGPAELARRYHAAGIELRLPGA